MWPLTIGPRDKYYDSGCGLSDKMVSVDIRKEVVRRQLLRTVKDIGTSTEYLTQETSKKNFTVINRVLPVSYTHLN